MTADASPCGWKFVNYYYNPLYGGMQIYLPDTTQTISQAAARRIRTRPMLRSEEALHFCKRAVDTLMHVTTFDISTLRLLHVTAVPMSPGVDVCFTEDDEWGVSGATALRVDFEVTNAAERAALLTGTATTIDFGGTRGMTTQRDYVNGVLLEKRTVDACGNVVRVIDDKGAETFGHYIVADLLRRNDDGTINKQKNAKNFLRAKDFVYARVGCEDGVKVEAATKVLFVTGCGSVYTVASECTVGELRHKMGFSS